EVKLDAKNSRILNKVTASERSGPEASPEGVRCDLPSRRDIEARVFPPLPCGDSLFDFAQLRGDHGVAQGAPPLRVLGARPEAFTNRGACARPWTRPGRYDRSPAASVSP